jgi:hypothetical protein
LHAQIFVYGALIQGTAADEEYQHLEDLMVVKASGRML